MGKRILLGCDGIPPFGGASTASYALFQMMQKDGFDVSYVNLISNSETDYFKYMCGEQFGNPKCLERVYNCAVNGSSGSHNSELTDLLSKISPDLIVGIGSSATNLLKKAFPSVPLIFLAPSCLQASNCILENKLENARELIEFIQTAKKRPRFSYSHEAIAVECSDLIVTNSDMTLLLFQYFYPSHSAKMLSDPIWSTEWVRNDALEYCGLQRPFHDRDIDVLFVATVWSRPEKNYRLVEKIVSRLSGFNIHIVGEIERTDTHATNHGRVMKREELFSLLGRSKTVVSTSFIDSAPGILVQAAAIGCNIVSSRNCGNWRLCHEDLLVERYHVNDFLQRIDRSLSSKYTDNTDYFLRMEGYKNLTDTFLVF